MSIGVEQRLGFFPARYDTVYFVSDQVGLDTNDGLSEFSAFKSLGAALDAIDTSGVASAIHFLDDSTYIVTEASGTPNERTTTVPMVLIGNSSTLIGQPTGVVWKVNNSRIDGMNVDGTDLTFRPTGSTTGQTDHLHNWFKIANPNTLYQTVSSDPTPNRWCIYANRVKGAGPFIDCDNAAASFYHVFCNDIGLDYNTVNSEYIFIGNGNGAIINYIGMNTDCSNTGSGAGKVIKLDNNANANLYFHCFGGGIANGGDINTSAVLYVNGSSVDGEPLTWSGTGEIHDHSIVDGINFENMNASAGLALADLINTSKSGRQFSASLTDLQTLIDTDTLAKTLLAGNSSGASDIVMANLQGIVLGIAGNRLDASGNDVTLDAAGDLYLEFNGGQIKLSEVASLLTIAPNVSSTTYQTSLANTRTTWNVQGNGAMNARLQLSYGNVATGYSRFEQAATNLQMLFGSNITLNIINGDGQDVDTVIRGDTDLNLLYVNAGLDNVGIGASANASTKLEVVSTTGGFVAPVMTAAQASAITPISGLMLYTTDTDATFTSIGYWVYEAGTWNEVTTQSGGITVVTKAFADSPYTTSNGEAILANAVGGAMTVNLPAAAANDQITIKKTDASVNTVTIDGSGAETIDGGLTAVLTTQYESITLVSDGSNWFII